MPSEGERPEVPRIVVDTNLFVGLVFRPQTPGPARLLDLWSRGGLRVCVSPPVLREVRATLRRLPVAEARTRGILDLLENPEATELFEEVEDSGWRCADPADDKFLHLAIAAGADALITSDRALLEVADFPVPVRKSGPWFREVDRGCPDSRRRLRCE